MMNFFSQMGVSLAMQARHTSYDIEKTNRSADSLERARFDRLPHEILLIIHSYLLDHEDFFTKTIINYSKTPNVKNSGMTLAETTDLKNAALLCRSITPVAQELLFHTICVDDQKRSPPYSVSWLFNELKGRLKDGSSSLLPFSESNLFRLIRLLIDTPHLRNHVKQLHISLPTYRYSNGQQAAVNKLEADVATVLGSDLDVTGSWFPGVVFSSLTRNMSFSQFQSMLWRWILPPVVVTDMPNQQLSFWLTALLVLLPKLQSLRLWDIHAGPSKFGAFVNLRHVTGPLPRLTRSCLSSGLTTFEMLRYVSLPIYGASGVLILKNLPHVKTAELCVLYGRAVVEQSPFFEKISHVENLRFPFMDLGKLPEAFAYATASILSLFEDVHSVEVYEGVDPENHRWYHEQWLLDIFSLFTIGLKPFRETLETLRFCGKFSYYENYLPNFPDLSGFHRLKTLILPQQLIFSFEESLMENFTANLSDITDPAWMFWRRKLDHLPPNIESLAIDRCCKFVLGFLQELVEHEDELTKLHLVHLVFISRVGTETITSRINENGHWKNAEGSKIKFGVTENYEESEKLDTWR